MIQVGEQIRKIRRSKDLSQEFVASKLGVSQNYVQKVESNKVKMSLDKLEQFAEVLEVEVGELLPSSRTEFHNCVNSGNFNHYHITHHFPEELINVLKEILGKSK